MYQGFYSVKYALRMHMLSKFKMADTEDDEAFLYGDEKKPGEPDGVAKNSSEVKTAEDADEAKENVKPEEKHSVENGANKADDKEDDDAKEAGELSNEDDEEDDDDDDDDDDVQVTIDEINTSGPGYGAPYATPVNWNFKGSAVGSASKGAATPAAGSKHLDLNAEGTVNGVGIYEFDLESAEERPWRKPGADITDYFNYGFTEDTWKQYCEKQRRMRLEHTMQKKIFAHHAGAPAPPGQTDIATVIPADARTRKAGPPPERRMEGSIDVIGAVGSRVESRRHQDDDMMPPHMMPDGMSKRGFPGPPMFNVPTSDHSMGPPQHIGGGPPPSSMAGPPPIHQGVPQRFPPGGPPGGPGGMPGILPPGMQQPPPGMSQPPGGFPPDGMPHDAMGFPGRSMGRGRGRGFGGHPGMPGMPPPGEFPPGMDERGPRIPFEDGMPPFYPGDAVQPFPPMMGPPPHGIPWDPAMGRGFMPNFRDQFPVGMPRPGGDSPGRGGRSDDDSEYGSSEEDNRRREREHKKRDKDKDRERSREHRERTRDRHSDRDRSPRRERDRERRDRDRESRRHRDRDKDREKGSDRDREKREERSSRRSKEQREKKRHKGSSEAQSADGQEEGEVVSKRRSRRTRESKQAEAKPEPAEQEEGQLSSP